MKRLFFRAKISVLSQFSSWFERINHLLVESIFATSKKIKTSNVEKLLKELCENAEVIIERAERYSQNPNFMPNEKELAYYYFLLKHYGAVYESRFGLIPPIQVFNEHRMALDHFIRAKSYTDTDREKHIGKAADHILRGLLDILKLNCAELKKIISKRHASFSLKILGGASDGEYIKEFVKLQNTAESKLYEAKCSEHNLEGIENPKIETVNKFIYAFVTHNEWHELQSKNMGALHFHRARYYAAKGITVIGSFLIGIAAGVIANHFFDIFNVIAEWLG